MFFIKGYAPREYQEKIASSCLKENTLVVVPTGLGKTKIAIKVAVERVNEVDGKVLFMTPTRPLAAQISKEFIAHTDFESVQLVTGMIAPKQRANIYKEARVIVSTPQTIENDIESHNINLKDFTLLVVDEVHRAVKKFAYTGVAKAYKKWNKNGRLIGLTASPGSDKVIIEEIKNHLGIVNVEIRSESDKDVKEYVQEKTIENVRVDLPPYFLDVVNLVKKAYTDRAHRLEAFGFKKNVRYLRKLDILTFQSYLHKQIKKGNKFAFSGVSLTAQLLKLSHAKELLETQGLQASHDFLLKLKGDKTKAALSILGDKNIEKAMKIMAKLEDNHPKVDKLKEVIIEQFKDNDDSRVIVFAKFRSTTKMICNVLSEVNVINPIELVGQKEGLKQSEQIQRIKDFGAGKYNVMIATNVGEEGLDIASADVAIFYDQVGNSVRKIQRSGRVGRMQAGKVINLITRGTRDESAYYAARASEKKMKTILSDSKKQVTLGEFSG